MSRLQEFCDRVEREGIVGISGANFKDHTSPNGKFFYRANTTPEQFCRDKGEIDGVTAEAYADMLLNIMDADGEKIVGECDKCFRLLTESEAETHQCDGEGRFHLNTPLV